MNLSRFKNSSSHTMFSHREHRVSRIERQRESVRGDKERDRESQASRFTTLVRDVRDRCNQGRCKYED